MEITTVGIDLAKSIFQVHAVDAAGQVVVRKALRRAQVVPFFAKLLPCLVGMEACGTSHHWARELMRLGHDVRLIQRDVILIRTTSKVKAGKTFAKGFRDTFDPPTVVGVARQKRGYVGVDAKLGNRRFRFVTTHLEAYDPEIGEKQARQLLRNELASKRRPSILMGDFNSDPKTGGEDSRGAERTPSAYNAITDAGFFNPLPRRETCCFPEDLHNSAKLDTWIDHIVVRPRVRVLRSSIVGSRTSDRFSGLWPSDHAGIAATLRLK